MHKYGKKELNTVSIANNKHRTCNLDLLVSENAGACIKNPQQTPGIV